MISIRAFYCPISENRADVRSGILIYPLPDADLFLRDRIARELLRLLQSLAAIDELSREDHHRE